MQETILNIHTDSGSELYSEKFNEQRKDINTDMEFKNLIFKDNILFQ